MLAFHGLFRMQFVFQVVYLQSQFLWPKQNKKTFCLSEGNIFNHLALSLLFLCYLRKKILNQKEQLRKKNLCLRTGLQGSRKDLEAWGCQGKHRAEVQLGLAFHAQIKARNKVLKLREKQTTQNQCVFLLPSDGKPIFPNECKQNTKSFQEKLVQG